jgi:hypothetical protein
MNQKWIFFLVFAGFFLIHANFSYSQNTQWCCDTTCCPPAEAQYGGCCYLVCNYEPCYYTTWNCEMINQVQQVPKCCYVPQYYTQTYCCYVPQYYTQTYCTYSPHYYCENVCTQYPHWTCETNCQMVPRYNYQFR